MVHHAAHHPNALAKYEHLNYRLEIFFSFLFRNDSMFFSNYRVSKLLFPKSWRNFAHKRYRFARTQFITNYVPY